MTALTERPIGVLDSGVGGLFITKFLMEKLPNENFIYFGDTAHMPYGKRSLEEIQQYTQAILDFFINQDCKLAIIACNTATAAMEKLLLKYKDKLKIFNVIDPVINYVLTNYPHRKVGLICTDLTYRLGVFENRIENQGDDIRLISLHASQLAHTIENEFENQVKLKNLIREYFFHHHFINVDAVILGCTHYLWLKEQFMKLNPFIDWIEPSALIEIAVRDYLKKLELLNLPAEKKTTALFYQLGSNKSFSEWAKKLTAKKLRESQYITNCAHIF